MIKIWNYGKTSQRRVKEFAVRETNCIYTQVSLIILQFVQIVLNIFIFIFIFIFILQILVDDLLVYNGTLDKYNSYGLVTFVKENSNENLVNR